VGVSLISFEGMQQMIKGGASGGSRHRTDGLLVTPRSEGVTGR
jgi:hypothetical protein